MPQSLHLEFACTDAEKRQAQSLSLERQVGGGSKVLTTVVLLLVLAGMLLGFYFRVQREVSAAYRPYVYAGVFGIALFFWFWRRRSRAAAPAEMGVDVSDEGLSIRGSQTEARLPWSAFSRLLESPDLFVLADRPGTTLLVLPKRAFPDESWREWFHTLATNQLSLAEPPPLEMPDTRPEAAGDSVLVRVRLRFRDYLDRSLASWLPRGFLAFITVMVLGVTVKAEMNPPPNAVFSAAQVFLMFMVPFLLVMAVIVVLVHSVRAWWEHSRNALPQELSFSPDSIAFRGPDGSGTLPWSTYDRFKETRWSFILWNSRAPHWVMLPKRAFSSDEDQSRCRDLLSRHLQQSTWYFG